MGRLPDTQDGLDHSDRAQPTPGALYIISTMADTTWRMFLPTIGLMWLGYYLDGQWHTKPLLLLIGAALGGGIAAVLVRLQFRKGTSR